MLPGCQGFGTAGTRGGQLWQAGGASQRAVRKHPASLKAMLSYIPWDSESSKSK